MTASVFSLAPRLASTSARAAAPSRARRTGSVHQQRPEHLAPARAPTAPRTAAPFVRNASAISLKFCMCGPKTIGFPKIGRLEDVVASMVDEAAADEDRRRDLVELRQLANRVEHDDVGAWLGVDRQLGSPAGREARARARGARLRRTAPAGAAPGSTSAPQADIALTRANAREHRRLFAAHRAAGDDDRCVLARAGRSAARAPAASRAPIACASSESNFRLPVTVTRAGSAPRSISRRADSSLCMQKRSTSASTRRKNGRIELVSRIGTRGDPPVDQRPCFDAPLATEAQQVRPDLGLHHDEEPRPDEPERPPDDERPVEWKIEDGIDVLQAAPRHLLPGHRRGGEEEAKARVARPEVGHEGAGGQRLADRDGVNPDRFLAVDIERDRQVAEAAAAGCRCTSCSGSPDTESTATRGRTRRA